ncbi:hypothetical protein UA45_06195 [Morganella morganii]|uniref:Uncharacterized protein n=1 Tax=Morganella morganii TaxID=582 RepID=A0A0D8LCE9_MORMO|nr:hypothetical protein UA45_06195 [Morganella morganii]
MITCQNKSSHWLGGACLVSAGLSVTAGYSHMKKDSVAAVFIQLYTDYPNSIGSVQRLPDDIGLVPEILIANGVSDLNHWNDIHSVKFWAELLAKVSTGFSGETLSYPNQDIPNCGEIGFCESIKRAAFPPPFACSILNIEQISHYRVVNG